MEIIVCSDNHGLIAPLEKIVKAYPKADAYIHCGDMELEKQYLEKFYAVTGNNDYFTSYPQELFVKVGDLKIYVTHGHQFYGDREQKLATKAINNHCQIACYGHTHRFNAEYVNGVLCLNPGSLRYNRDGSNPCFARVVVNEDKTFEITRIDVKSL
jgi:uncharacterized protein